MCSKCWAPELAQSSNTGKTLSGKTLTDATGMPVISGFQGYQQYPGQQIAQFTPLQKQAFQGAEQMQVAPQLAGATTAAQNATNKALGTGYSFDPYQTQSITQGNNLQNYMSPYMQNVSGCSIASRPP
jgi:hypothetical protein